MTTQREVFDRIGPAARSTAPCSPRSPRPSSSHSSLASLSISCRRRRATGSAWRAPSCPRVGSRPHGGCRPSWSLRDPGPALSRRQAAGSAALADILGGHWFPDAPNIVSFTVTQELIDEALHAAPHRHLAPQLRVTPTTTMAIPRHGLRAGCSLTSPSASSSATPTHRGRCPAAHRRAPSSKPLERRASPPHPHRAGGVERPALPRQPEGTSPAALAAGHVVVVPDRPGDDRRTGARAGGTSTDKRPGHRRDGRRTGFRHVPAKRAGDDDDRGRSPDAPPGWLHRTRSPDVGECPRPPRGPRGGRARWGRGPV